MEREFQRPPEDEELIFTRYIKKVPGVDFLAVLQKNHSECLAMFRAWSQTQWNSRYAPDKWSLKEVILHIIGTERIFAYRALRIARHDLTPLPGFSQDDYIPYLYADQRSNTSVIEEYNDTRKATISLFRNLPDEAMLFTGTAADFPLTPLSIGFIIAGHEIHHLEIIREKYLSQ